MYAVIESGGKQYRVELGSRIQVDRLDAQPGDSITLDRVLLVADGDTAAIGQPVVGGAVVSAEVLGQDRGDKIVVFKYKPKARTRVKKGFRADLTTLRISDISFGGKSAATDAKSAEAKRAKVAEEAEKAAAEKAAADKELAAKLAASAPAAGTKAKPRTRRKKSTPDEPGAATASATVTSQGDTVATPADESEPATTTEAPEAGESESAEASAGEAADASAASAAESVETTSTSEAATAAEEATGAQAEGAEDTKKDE